MENPVLRFIAASDLHYCFEPDGTEAFSVSNFETSLRNAYAWADSQPYRRIDALYIAGDFVMNGTEAEMRRVRGTLDSCVKPETEVTLILGSHECENEDENEAVASDRLRSIFGMEPDTHKVINGFDFIGLSSVVREFYFFGSEKRDWLRRELQNAAERRPRMPVFVFQHPHIRSTVAGEGRWGTSELTEILMDYPQVIDFSGHSHAPINSPLALHQQYFTSVNTGSFWGFDLCEYDKRGGSCPADDVHAAQFQIVEVWESGCITVMPFDGCSGTFYPVSWFIETPWEPESFAYTSYRCEQRAKPPRFPATAAITAQVSGTKVLLRFNQAAGEVRDYWLIIRRWPDGLVIRQTCVTSQYYLRTPPSQIECVFSGLNPGRYRANVHACGFWGNKSEHALEAMFDIQEENSR